MAAIESATLIIFLFKINSPHLHICGFDKPSGRAQAINFSQAQGQQTPHGCHLAWIWTHPIGNETQALAPPRRGQRRNTRMLFLLGLCGPKACAAPSLVWA
jgi:hypothetical protein